MPVPHCMHRPSMLRPLFVPPLASNCDHTTQAVCSIQSQHKLVFPAQHEAEAAVVSPGVVAQISQPCKHCASTIPVLQRGNKQGACMSHNRETQENTSTACAKQERQPVIARKPLHAGRLAAAHLRTTTLQCMEPSGYCRVIVANGTAAAVTAQMPALLATHAANKAHRQPPANFRRSPFALPDTLPAAQPGAHAG